ncbi:Fe-S cluster containing protein [Cyanobium sp. N.Huapi 1H5]|uniref:Light dependent period protein LdpA domain-containing protein n=1 Tax=Cyanobium sp. N.Huapi 1H5 TaxID=2823719 RepID=UPI0020CEF855|nr:LdpA C-terminal domain-containing domain [Cyanobium sp. N.Huapi 1H5]MCP9837313.1 Fe-S cluster containing protein [Cyanobium sp. N.Huapi 1H5]
MGALLRGPAPLLRQDPEQALAAGCWVKLIGGASNQDLAAIEDLAGIHALAGVHCIDVAADPAVVAAARRGMAWAEARSAARPWLMVSLSDGLDPHFRKAWFDPARCPPACPRPCERVCPALAIVGTGVVEERCYGCGRCLPACPLGLIEERSQVLEASGVGPLLAQLAPDAVELHTRPGRLEAFGDRVAQLAASGVPLRRVAVSAALEGGATVEALAAELWARFRLLRGAGFRPLWQLDGRPMSGDVGAGTAHAAVALLERLGPMAPPGPLQLAGGTNAHTLAVLARSPAAGPGAAGVAFGGVARRQLQPLLQEAQAEGRRLLDLPLLWPRALAIAEGLVAPWLARGAAGPRGLPGPGPG